MRQAKSGESIWLRSGSADSRLKYWKLPGDDAASLENKPQPAVFGENGLLDSSLMALYKDLGGTITFVDFPYYREEKQFIVSNKRILQIDIEKYHLPSHSRAGY